MLAFRRFDFLSFRGFMTRFATLLRLRGGDLPFGEEEQKEEEAEPSFETERERQIFELKKMSAKKSGFAGIAGIAGMTGGRRVDRAKEEMTEAEVRALVLEGCDDDATLATLVLELDDCCTVQTSMFSKEARREARAACCSSLTLLSLQSYYFYWCLFFVLAGDYSRSVWPLSLRRSAARFARYSDRVFTYLVGSSASHTFPSFLPFTLHGALRPFVESVSKTLLLVDVLKVWSGYPYRAVGMNSILIYVVHEFLGDYIPFSWGSLCGVRRRYKFQQKSHWTTMINSYVLGVGMWILIANEFYRQGVFFKICCVCHNKEG